MTSRVTFSRWRDVLVVTGLTVVAAACGGGKDQGTPASTATPAAAPAATTAATQQPAAPVAAAPTSWSPEALEELLAPVALYPDPVLSQMLIASTNPQEVLDAGNWLIANEGLKGDALDEAAAKVGFTPPIRALVQFPQVMDMMCMEMGWTTELGQAFIADQAGVLDAVQRLRKQAQDVGNLKSSEAMKVETETQEGKEVVVLKPAKPEVVYVPQYDPQVVYAPVPAVAATAAPATTTTTTTVVEHEDEGHSTGALVTTGLLAFGAGILVNEAFDDNDDYYYPHYGYGGMPYYPPYPYRPPYGGGYYPSNGYNRPPNYNSGFQNNGNIIINNPGGGGGRGNNYWDRYDNRGGRTASTQQARSPITAARPNRPELNELNQRKPRPMPADAKRPSSTATASNWKGQSSYAGKNRSSAAKGGDAASRIAQANPEYSKPPRSATAKGTSKGPAPKVQGSYAGAKPTANRDTGARTKPAERDVPRASPNENARPRPDDAQRAAASRGAADRGYGAGADTRGASPAGNGARTADRADTGASNRSTAMSGADRGASERAASQRGRQSMPQGARSKGGGNQSGNRRSR
jgi:hypothetical protein